MTPKTLVGLTVCGSALIATCLGPAVTPTFAQATTGDGTAASPAQPSLVYVPLQERTV